MVAATDFSPIVVEVAPLLCTWSAPGSERQPMVIQTTTALIVTTVLIILFLLKLRSECTHPPLTSHFTLELGEG